MSSRRPCILIHMKIEQGHFTSAHHRVLLERWSAGDYRRFASAISYPDRYAAR